MSAADTKRSWNTLIDGQEDENSSKEKSKRHPDSRESSSSRKRTKPNGKNDSETKQCRPPKKPIELETDPGILQRRQKQIDYGKNTVGYHNYLNLVPMNKRLKGHPRTPDKYAKYSRRSWDTLIKMWRKRLHEYDTEENAAEVPFVEEDCVDYTDSDDDDDEDDKE